MACTKTNAALAVATMLGLGACSDDGLTGQTGVNTNGGSGATTAQASTGAADSPQTTGVGSAGGTTEGTGLTSPAPTTSGSDTSGPANASSTGTTGATDGVTDSSSGSSTDAGESTSTGEGSSSSEGGPVCQAMGGSCAMGQACCPGLMCCGGVPVPPGAEFCGAPCPISDYKRKREFAEVDVDEVLDKVAALPITTWSYRFEDAAVRHIGPMAQDFQASFDVGASDESIFVIDADGVSLAAIKALYGRLQASEARNTALQETVDDLERRLRALERR